ncbi:MAG: hypothetical protein JNM27_01635 [Leptospirales bacterium]|nr:hypothetical protein [Leptospirales bacterium]
MSFPTRLLFPFLICSCILLSMECLGIRYSVALTATQPANSELISQLDAYVLKNTDPADERSAELVFKDRVTGVKLGATHVRLPYELKPVRSAIGPVIAVSYFSGGESGCCFQMDLLQRKGNSLRTSSISTTAYGAAPEIRDVDSNGVDEIIVTNTDFYGRSHKSDACELTPGIHQGISDLRFPGLWHISEGGKELGLIEVTFNPVYVSFVQASMLEAAGYLKSHKGQPLQCGSSPDLASYGQLIQYARKMDQESEGFRQLREAGILVTCPCLRVKQQSMADFVMLLD